MSIPVFPTLSVNPVVNSFGHEPSEDPVYRSDTKDGALLVRTRTTWIPLILPINYIAIGDADKELLETFEKDTLGCGGLRFMWTNPQNNKLYLAVLNKQIDYKINPQGHGDLWDVLLEFQVLRRFPILFGAGLLGEGLMCEG